MVFCHKQLRYDVSRGYAKWVPGTLLGHDLEGGRAFQLEPTALALRYVGRHLAHRSSSLWPRVLVWWEGGRNTNVEI